MWNFYHFLKTSKNDEKWCFFGVFEKFISGADFFWWKKIKSWATRGSLYSAHVSADPAHFSEKGPVESLFSPLWGGYPPFIIKNCAKNDWKKAALKKKCFLKGKKVHIFAFFWGRCHTIGVDMIPGSRPSSSVFFSFFLIKKKLWKFHQKTMMKISWKFHKKRIMKIS